MVASSKPIFSITGFTYSRENAPDPSLGVGTTTKVASASAIAPSYLVVAESLFELLLISPLSRGS